MSAILQTSAAGKKYGRRWALRDCTLTIPAGKVVGLVLAYMSRARDAETSHRPGLEVVR
jgi:hypothetical protein